MLAGVGLGIAAIVNRKAIGDTVTRAGRGFIEQFGPAIAEWFAERQLAIALAECSGASAGSRGDLKWLADAAVGARA